MKFHRTSAAALVALAVSGVSFLTTTASDAQDAKVLRAPVNSALSLPLGQGLDLVQSAEPLGKSRFRMRALNRSTNVNLPELGDGSSYTGLYGLGYGFSDRLDVSLMVPFFLDSAGGISKYGTSDPVLGFKLASSGVIPSGFYRAFQLLLGLPLGYKGEHEIDKTGGVRPFSNEALDTGLNFLMDLHFNSTSLFFNGGLYRSGNPDVVSQLVYGIGAEFWRRSRWASLNIEYQSRVALADQSRAVGVMKIGTRLQLFRGFELELGREFGFHDHPTKSTTTFGVRTHGYLTGRRRLESRTVLYQPVPKPKRVYEPDKVLRIAVLDFGGFEEYDAGTRLVNKIKSRLEPHDSLEVVDLADFKGIPKRGMLTPMEASDLARKLGVDVVVSGTVSDYEIDRFAGLKVPFVFEVPETEIKVSLRYRVMWFSSQAKSEMESLIEEISGQGLLRKRVRLLPGDQRDITVSRTALEIEKVHELALDDVVGNFLDSMSAQFSWIPPDFDL